MLRSVARLASRGAARRGIATGDNLLKVAASDLQPARTWDAAEADGKRPRLGSAQQPSRPGCTRIRH